MPAPCAARPAGHASQQCAAQQRSQQHAKSASSASGAPSTASAPHREGLGRGLRADGQRDGQAQREDHGPPQVPVAQRRRLLAAVLEGEYHHDLVQGGRWRQAGAGGCRRCVRVLGSVLAGGAKSRSSQASSGTQQAPRLPLLAQHPPTHQVLPDAQQVALHCLPDRLVQRVLRPAAKAQRPRRQRRGRAAPAARRHVAAARRAAAAHGHRRVGGEQLQ